MVVVAHGSVMSHSFEIVSVRLTFVRSPVIKFIKVSSRNYRMTLARFVCNLLGKSYNVLGDVATVVLYLERSAARTRVIMLGVVLYGFAWLCLC